MPTSPRTTYLSGLLLALTGSVFFSAKAVVAKLLYREGIDAVTLIALRMLLSLPVFLAVAIYTWRRKPRLSANDLWRIAGLGLLGYYASSMLDFLGLQYLSAGLERLILFLTPSFVLLLGIVWLRRPVTARQWLSLVVAYGGVVLVFWHDLHLGGRNTVLGSALVLGAALVYAVYLLASGELLKRVGAGPASLAGMIGPVSTLFLAYWLLAEPITGLQLAGTALVLAGMLLLSSRAATAAAPKT